MYNVINKYTFATISSSLIVKLLIILTEQTAVQGSVKTNGDSEIYLNE